MKEKLEKYLNENEITKEQCDEVIEYLSKLEHKDRLEFIFMIIDFDVDKNDIHPLLLKIIHFFLIKIY